MGGALLPHHRICAGNPSRSSAFFLRLHALRRDATLHRAPRRVILCCSSPAPAAASPEGNGEPPPPAGTVKKRSREELIAFFRGIQTSIAMASPRPPKTAPRKKQAPPSHDEERDVQPRARDLEDMKVAELRALARARRMKGYSKMKKRELVDRLKGV